MEEKKKTGIKPLHAVLAVALVGLLVFVYFQWIAVGGVASTSRSYSIKVTGTDGLRFNGAITFADAAGANERTVEGVVPAEYSGRGVAVGACLQKRDGGGVLKVAIYEGTRLCNQAESGAAYGVVTVSN